jgi:DNA polymerase-1
MAQPVRTEEGRRIRSAYVAGPGCRLVSSDYSQVEMRVTASESGDARMLDIFRNKQDIHAQTASWMFGIPEGELDEMKHRYPAKRVGFGVLNDISAAGLQRELIKGGGAREEDWPLSRCQEMIHSWFDIYTGVAAYMKASREHAMRYGWVRDMWGRRRLIPGVRMKTEYLRQEALRQAANAPIQMGAQGIIKQAMGELVPLYRSFHRPDSGDVCMPLIQIHDDILMEISKTIADTYLPLQVAVMESAAPPGFQVPLEVDIKVGERWGEMKKWEV